MTDFEPGDIAEVSYNYSVPMRSHAKLTSLIENGRAMGLKVLDIRVGGWWTWRGHIRAEGPIERICAFHDIAVLSLGARGRL